MSARLRLPSVEPCNGHFQVFETFTHHLSKSTIDISKSDLCSESAMTSQQMSLITPLASPLPPPPEGDVLTPSQWTTLMAIGDTVIPALEFSPTNVSKLKATLPPGADTVLASTYLSEQASTTPGLKDLIHRTLHDFIRQDAQQGISVILTALEYALFYDLPFHTYF